MSLEQLMGRHARLQRELAQAFCMQPWPGARIERLAEELAAAEVKIALLQPSSPAGDESPTPAAMLKSR